MSVTPIRAAEIRMAVRLSDLVGERVALKPTRRGEWVGLCPFHHEKTPSFSVCDTKRFFHCFGCGAHGDAISWVIKTTSARTYREAVEYLGARCALGEATAVEARPLDAAAERAADPENADRRRRAAQRLFLEARPLTAGDPVWRYLAGRGLDLDRPPRIPRALRYHPSCWNSEARRELPAMVAAVVSGEGRFLAAHRTWLAVQPNGRVVKAPLATPKASLGGVAGGAIRVSRGEAGRRWREGSSDEEVVAAEGIEDAIAAALLLPAYRVVSTISLGNLRHLALPPGVNRLVWCEQNDPPSSGARVQLARAVAELVARGVRVRFLRPPVFVKDLAVNQRRSGTRNQRPIETHTGG